MELENQVCSLELSKKLKELGVKQESLWYWNSKNELRSQNNFLEDEGKFVASAFTVAELGEMLPCEIEQKYLSCYRVHILAGTTDEKYEWECGYREVINGKFFIANTEANARAKMLIYLIENKIGNY